MTPATAGRVLFMAPVEPWCRENGSSVIIADLLEGLGKIPGLDMLPIFLRRPPDGYTPKPPARFPGVTIGVQGLPRWLSVAKAVMLGSSPIHQRFANRDVVRRVLETIRHQQFSPTLIHVEHLPLVEIGWHVARAFGCPIVYRAHNIESQLWERRLGVRGPLGRALVRHLERCEAQAIESCRLTLCISDVDLKWVRSAAPSASTELLPCSLLLERYDAVAARYHSPDPQIGFVGGLDWAPNEVGLRWFVEEVLPRVTAEVPDARFAVLARGAAERPWLASNPAIRILPQEADAGSLFASSRVSIAPLLQGGGVRIKIPESLMVGCPVVATTVGAEGLDLPGLTRTDDPAAFAAGCARHLREASSPESRRAVRAAVDARHGAGVLAERLVGWWSALTRGERAAVR